MAAYTITFNGYSLQDASFRTRIMQHTNIPGKIVQAESRARDNGMTIVNVKFSSRSIEVTGRLTAADRSTLVAKVDQMKLALGGVSGTLDIEYGSGTRRYFATVDSLELPEDFFNLSFVDYKIRFFCADPFGYATNSGIISVTGQSAQLLDLIVTASGSTNTYPVMSLTINTSSGFSLLTFSNETTGEAIVISKPGGNFSNGDIVTINGKLKVAYINNSGVDYTGRFPSLQVPSSRLRVSIQAVNVNYDLTYQYDPLYL